MEFVAAEIGQCGIFFADNNAGKAALKDLKTNEGCFFDDGQFKSNEADRPRCLGSVGIRIAQYFWVGTRSTL